MEKEIREVIANTALTLLNKDEDYKNLAYTKVEFAYIYIEDTGIESMFKIITDKKTIAFGVNKSNVMRLDDNFLSIYDEAHKTTINLHGGERFKFSK